MTRIEVTDRGAVVARESAYTPSSICEGGTFERPYQAPERPAPPTCLLCGNPGIEGNELTLTTLGFDFVSDAFPVHAGCGADFLRQRIEEAAAQKDEYNQAVDHMMREALEW